MELRKRTVEEKRQDSKSTAPKDAECACSDIVTGLILCGVPQFTKVMPASDGAVKIPDGFVLEHCGMIRRKVTLEPRDAKGQVFEVMLETGLVGQRNFGTGWREFRSENGVREGDLLIFALVASSQFVVYILRGHSEIAKRAMASYFTPATRSRARTSSDSKRTLTEQEPEEEIHETEHKPGDSAETPARYSYFVRRLHANAFSKGRGKRTRCFEFPQAFLRSHAAEIGDTVEFVVPRKRQAWRIATFSAAGGARMFLSTGWLQFLEDNALQQGDDIAIALVARSKFLVTVVARASDRSNS